MRVTFFNVGQGDCILIEWQSDSGDKKFGLIDGNQSPGIDSLMSYLRASDVKELYFILLSHPHHDHFSGLANIIDQCKNANIVIKNFVHTSQLNKNYIMSSVKGIVATDDLTELFLKIGLMHKKGETTVSTMSTGLFSEIPLNNSIKLKVLAPDKIELDKYLNSEGYSKLMKDEEQPENKPLANFLSTTIILENDNWYVLLTSDTEKSAFLRSSKTYQQELKKKLVLGQCSHHGALSNFASEFWRSLKKDNGTPVVISVGKNSYGHPSGDVVDKLKKYNYDVYSTNSVGGLLNVTIATEAKSFLLDLVSKKVPSLPLEGHKSFLITDLGQVTFDPDFLV